MNSGGVLRPIVTGLTCVRMSQGRSAIWSARVWNLSLWRREWLRERCKNSSVCIGGTTRRCDGDRERCRRAGIPDEVVYRPKWRIALDLLDRTMGNGVQFQYLTADEVYGRRHQFRSGVAQRGLYYMLEVNRSQPGWAPRSFATLQPGQTPHLARRADQTWKRGGPSWTQFHIKNTHRRSWNGPSTGKKASRAHVKRRFRELRARGIYVSKIRKCYHVF